MRVRLTRRGFFGVVVSFLASGCVFRPESRPSFGGDVDTGFSIEDAFASIANPLYVPEARAYLVRTGEIAPLEVVDGPALVVSALSQRCPHQGCKVPWCASSQWFECPCHGAMFNRIGERRAGPAPRGMDSYAVVVRGGRLVIRTGKTFPGAALGTDTIRQLAAGPHCIGARTPNDKGDTLPNTLAPMVKSTLVAQ